MDSVKTIRAIERAFAVMQALQQHADGATLAELQAATALSGPTVMRILKTLAGVHAVRRSMADQRWRNSLQLNVLAEAVHPVDRLADVAAPWLDLLCRQVEWPSDLAIHMDGEDCMRVLESNLRMSRFFIRRSANGSRVNLLMSAAGGAFLAALPTDRRGAMVERAREGRDAHNLKAIALGDTERSVARARLRGYAVRHRLYRGGPYNGEPLDDAVNAIAVPIVGRRKLLGALNINWNRSAMTEATLVARHLASLQAAAAGIARDAERQGVVRQLTHLEMADWPA